MGLDVSLLDCVCERRGDEEGISKLKHTTKQGQNRRRPADRGGNSEKGSNQRAAEFLWGLNALGSIQGLRFLRILKIVTARALCATSMHFKNSYGECNQKASDLMPSLSCLHTNVSLGNILNASGCTDV